MENKIIKFKEIGIPIIVWLFFIPQSINLGLKIASVEIEPNDVIPLKYLMIILLVLFLFSLIITMANYFRPKMRFETILEKILTKESYDIIVKRVWPSLLGTLFFCLPGLVGLIKCMIINSPTINKEILLFPLMFGIGIFVGASISNIIKKSQLNKNKDI